MPTLLDDDQDTIRDLEHAHSLPSVIPRHEETALPGVRQKESDATEGPSDTPGKTASANELNESEKKPESLYKGDDDKDKGGGGGRLQTAKNFAKKHSKKLWFAGAGIGLSFGGLMVLLFLAGSLLIPNLFESMLTYRFASTARNFRRINSQLLARQMNDQALDDSKWARVRDATKDFKSRATLAKYRPAAIVTNLQATGQLSFKYEPRSNTASQLLRGPKMVAIILNGEEIPITQKARFGIPFSAASDNIRLSKAVDDALYRSWKGPQGPLAILRTSVGAEILKSIGWSGFYAWANKAKNYQGKSAVEANRIQMADQANRVHTTPNATSNVEPVKNATTATTQAMQACLKTATCLDEILAKNGGMASSVLNATNAALQTTVLQNVTRGISLGYSVALPLCLVVDGSAERAGPLIDAKSAAVQKQFLYFGAAAHQQKAGAVSSEAVKSITHRFNGDGSAARSNAAREANGSTPTTDTISSPQGSALGDLTLLDVLFKTHGGGFSSALLSTCGYVTSTWFGITEGIGELIVGFFTGGGSAAAGRVAAESVGVAVRAYLASFARQLVAKKTLKRLVIQGGEVAGATMLARMLVASYAGEVVGSGTAMGAEGLDEIHAGATGLASEENKLMGARPLTSAEVIGTRAANRVQTVTDTQALSPFERYFAVSNVNSLVSRMGMTLALNAHSSSVSSTMASIGGKLFNPFALLGMITSFGPSASAADLRDTSSYGMIIQDYSEEEKQFIETNFSFYDTDENERALRASGKEQAIQDKYGKCWDESPGTLLAAGDTQKNEDGTVIADKGLCSPKNLDMHNNEFGDKMILRWRILKGVLAVGNAGVEIGDPTESTQPTGGGTLSGNAQELARQVLERKKAGLLRLTEAAELDVTKTANNTPITYCVSDGARDRKYEPVTIHPALLQLLLKVTDPAQPVHFNIGLNNFLTSHDCDGGQHPKGRAMDVEFINNKQASPDNNPDASRQAAQLMANLISENGGGGMGQSTCNAYRSITWPANVEHFADTCDHIHVDVRGVK